MNKCYSLLLNKNVFLFFFIYITIFSVSAQQVQPVILGEISGKIIDSVSTQAIEFATITVSRQDNNKVVKGLSSDKNGLFSINGIPNGKFKVSISFVGYKTLIRNNININKNHFNVNLGTIPMIEERTNLKEVVVTSNRIIIEDKGDKTVYNVERDITSQSGVAADVLKKVPQVSVDVNGNVELQGNSNVHFLINGKPSIIFGNNIADVLQSIPASQIKNIEVITSQSAKDDAEGTGGIINIVLKKSTAEGVNGNVSLTGGTRLQNGSFNLNAHHGHFGANAFVNGNALLPTTTTSNLNRTSIDSLNRTSILSQDGSSKFIRHGYQSGIGLDWDISPKDNMSASFGFNYFGNSGNGPVTSNTVLNDALGNVLSQTSNITNSDSKYHTKSMQWGLNYKHAFEKEDQKLEFSYLSSLANNYSYYLQNQSHTLSDSIYDGSYAANPGTQKQTDFTVDYKHPFSKKFVIETGAKASIMEINNTTNVYELNTNTNDYAYNHSQSMTFDYRSTIYAGYLSGKFKLFDILDITAGARYEYTNLNATVSDMAKIALKSYGTFVPSAIVSHTFPKKRTIKISYTRRLQRPNYNDLNPFINASNPTTLSTGNTQLRPEIGNKIELGFTKAYDKGSSINATLFYQGNTDDIQSYTQKYDSYTVGDTTYKNITIASRKNVGHENNYGVNLFISIPITKKINFRTNISGFERFIDVGSLPGGNIQGFNYRINMNASYEVSKSLVMEFFGNFNSPRINVQGKMPSFTTYNFALRKQFFDGKASIAFTATNPFSKYVVQKTELTGVNFTQNSVRNMPFRSFGLNISYKFGKLEFKQEKTHEIDDSNLNNPPMGN